VQERLEGKALKNLTFLGAYSCFLVVFSLVLLQKYNIQRGINCWVKNNLCVDIQPGGTFYTLDLKFPVSLLILSLLETIAPHVQYIKLNQPALRQI
jgi:hypothetical protein